MPSKEQLDEWYNFRCPGCLKRRNKRASRLVAGIQYCKACAASIMDDTPPKPTGLVTVEHYETRSTKEQIERDRAMVEWKARHHAKKRGRT